MVKPIKKRKKKGDITDPYISLPEKFMHAVSTNGKAIAIWAAGIVAVIVIVVGIYSYFEGKSKSASEAFFAAMDTYRKDSELSAASAAKNKQVSKTSYNGSIDRFNGIISNYGGSVYGAWSKVYIGNCYRKIGEDEKAKSYYLDFVKNYSKTDLVMFEAYQNLTTILVDEKKFDEAIKYSNEYIGKEGPMVPEEFLKRIAFCYEQKKDLKNAEITYRRIVEEYPESQFSGIAKEKADDIKTILMQGL